MFNCQLHEKFFYLLLWRRSCERSDENLPKALNEQGNMINELDIIIAGNAAANNQTLITKDKDFLNLENNKIIEITHQ